MEGHISTQTYAPKKGYHINKAEAQAIGQGLEVIQAKHGDGFDISVFERHCQRDRGVLHAVWDRRRQHFINNAGREAARYLMNGVQVIVLRTAKSTQQPARPIVLLPPGGKISGSCKERVFTGDSVAGDSDLLQQAEDKMIQNIKGAIDNFILVAGRARALKAVKQLLSAY